MIKPSKTAKQRSPTPTKRVENNNNVGGSCGRGDDYNQFLGRKAQEGCQNGFDPKIVHDFLFDFQKELMIWACRHGRSAIFADCGLGKTPMALAWADNVVRKTGQPVLILTPLAVAHQFVREGEKFGIPVGYCKGREVRRPISVTNYEKLHHFVPSDWAGVVCDESSILKNFGGKTRKQITEFLRTIKYRLFCTATAAPNDYIEYGTSSEALGVMGYMDMLARFFKHDSGSHHPGHGIFSKGGWRFRGYAERDFYRWLCSWARALRKPSDMGFSDARFKLPELNYYQYVVTARTKGDGMLFDLPANTLEEQRHERRRTLVERCEKVAELINDQPTVVWCNLNDESSLLRDIIPGATEVSGADPDDKKEERFEAFERGQIKTLVTKPTIGGYGLNWQHCAHQTFFPSHSFEQMYQSVRRSWRFGQKKPVTVDIVTSEGEAKVLANLQRKAAAADKIFTELVALMNDALHVSSQLNFNKKEEMPKWL